ncbi:MAG TPA: mannosyltransferase [Nakamurella multipartita]|jgi:alpha-1,2-mannosyltransferase|nr:mannosyltransferase [Nakamurella multipartita]
MRRFVASSWAPWALLAVTIVLHVLVTLAGSDAFAMVDLKVYLEGAQHLTDGTLYDFFSEPLHLPFTYPTFSAIIFTPMTWLPWTVLRVLWQAASFGAIGLIAYATLRLLGRAGPKAPQPLEHVRGIVVTITALGLWLEPVRTTFNYGQINLFLCALLLAGAVASKEWLAGASVGLAAGVKLTPAITGLYYLLQRRWSAVAWSVVFFAGTVLLGLALVPSETVRFFTALMFDPARTGPVWSAINQSLRGAIARLAGQDLTSLWLVTAVLAAALGLWAAWACLRVGDRTAGLLAVQITGLLISPISWSHHWVWVLPLLLWCLFGPRQRVPAVRGLAIVWFIATCSYVVSLLIALQYIDQPASRPGWQSALGVVYPLLGVITLVVLGVLAIRTTAPSGPNSSDPVTPPDTESTRSA